jgi:hypothetical protein
MGRLYFAAALFMLLVPFLLLSLFSSLRTRKQAILFGCAVIVVVGAVAFSFSEAADRLLWNWGAPPAPPDQSRFVAAATRVREQAAEDVDAPRLERLRTDLCRTPDAIADWTGKIVQVFDTPSNRRKVVSIGIAPFLVLRTSLFDDATDTLISEGSELFRLTSALSPGDPVRFSGRFVAGAGACDPGQNAADALREPNFIVRFSAISRYTDR